LGARFCYTAGAFCYAACACAKKYQAPTANKKAEGTAVVYRIKFGSPMSQMGHKRTSGCARAMSALPPKADILDVRFVPEAVIVATEDVIVT